MIVDQQTAIPVPIDRAWAFVTDIAAVSRCLPGVEEFEPAGDDTYLGAMKVKVGPIGIRLQGKVAVAEQDAENHRTRLRVEASERRINSTVTADVTLTLVALSDGSTELHSHTDAAIMGKLGEFGQAVMRRKADQIMDEFTRNMARNLAAQG